MGGCGAGGPGGLAPAWRVFGMGIGVVGGGGGVGGEFCARGEGVSGCVRALTRLEARLERQLPPPPHTTSTRYPTPPVLIFAHTNPRRLRRHPPSHSPSTNQPTTWAHRHRSPPLLSSTHPGRVSGCRCPPSPPERLSALRCESESQPPGPACDSARSCVLGAQTRTRTQTAPTESQP